MKLAFASTIVLSAIGLLSSASAQSFADGKSVPVGQAYVYTTTSTGGAGPVRFKITTPPPSGEYMMSFVANFKSIGSQKTTAAFTCWMQTTSSNNIGESTTADVGAFDVGVSAQTFVDVKKGVNLGVYCSSNHIKGWKWANVPLKIVLVRLDGKTVGTTKAQAVFGTLSVDRAANPSNSGGGMR